MSPQNFRAIPLFLLLLLMSGCEYHFAPHPIYWGNSFHVDVVSNRSAYPWLGPEFQKILTLKLIQERSLKMVSREYADLIFTTKILNVNKHLKEIDQNSQVSESQFVIDLEVKIKTPNETYKTTLSNLSYRPASATYRPDVGDNHKNTPRALSDEKTGSIQALHDLANAVLIDFAQRSPSRHNPKVIKDLKKVKLLPSLKDDL
jgi:hypothetical protein